MSVFKFRKWLLKNGVIPGRDKEGADLEAEYTMGVHLRYPSDFQVEGQSSLLEG